MRTRIQFLLATILLFGISSCSKDKDTDNTKVKTKTELLTEKTWVYNEYFTQYDQKPTTLAYKRNKTNNTLDLSKVSVKFNTDGTYSETLQGGGTLPGTWKFIEGETKTEVKNSMGTFIATVITLDENHFIWYDPTNLGGILAEVIHP